MKKLSYHLQHRDASHPFHDAFEKFETTELHELSLLVADIYESGKIGWALLPGQRNHDVRRNLLNVLAGLDAAVKEGDHWKLSDLGQVMLADIGVQITGRLSALALRTECQPSDWSTWELVQWLDAQGWFHVVATDHNTRKKAKEPHVVGGTKKVWFTKDTEVSHYYLLCLVSFTIAAQNDDMYKGIKIPHFAKTITYMELLGLEIPKKHRKSVGL